MAIYNTYDKGDRIRMQAQFTLNGQPADPTEVSLIVKEPDGIVTTGTYGGAQVSRDVTGTYYQDRTLDQVGRWDYQFAGVGAVIATQARKLEVRLTEF